MVDFETIEFFTLCSKNNVTPEPCRANGKYWIKFKDNVNGKTKATSQIENSERSAIYEAFVTLRIGI